MLTATIRQNFLQYFRSKGHTVVPSSPVIPFDDPTLLFINAGMNQFKDVFLGESVRDYTRAASSQKCVRVGGKHNDLENVGHTSRHLTFFEMLGNFSFGDYFKEEAIKFAWEVATEVLQLDPEKIWGTVFREDDEAFELWKAHLPESRITRFDEADNFWQMGDTGPCGPCSELLYDRGPAYGDGTNPHEDPSGERYIEFWNLVFMQYNRSADGKMDPLPKPSIDTGAGLERIVALKMEVGNVFDTDTFRALIAQIEAISGKKYDPTNEQQAAAFRVIADHLRCLAFAIADGAQPSNVERGYVLRKVLRRAVRYGRMLDMNEPFLARVFPRLLETMGDHYNELKKSEERIQELLTVEEESFIRTLNRGGNLLTQITESAHKTGNVISGDDAFKLKDTYGFPLEEVELFAVDAGLTVDLTRYQELEKEAKERSKQAHKKTAQTASANLFESYAKEHGAAKFVGFSEREKSGRVMGIVFEEQFVSSLEEGQEGLILLDKTPFYAEMGGQIGDTGSIASSEATFMVSDTQSPYKGVIAHVGKMTRGTLSVGDEIHSEIDGEKRHRIENNHTATHLLHWALCNVLGEHVKQSGSVVEPHRLRFDFTHHKGVTQEEIHQIEDLINNRIRSNLPVKTYELSYDDVQKREDIKQFFGEKYGKTVRVVDAEFCKELCGGCHTSHLGNIGFFKITKEESISAGVRRMIAVTGKEAEQASRQSEEELAEIASLVKTTPNKLKTRIQKLNEEMKELQQQLKAMQKGQLASLVAELKEQVEMVGEIPFVGASVPLSGKELREFGDQLMNKIGSGVMVLANASGQQCSLMVRVSSDLVGKGIKAGDLIKEIAPLVDGKGGGKPDSAQAGGKAPEKIPQALSFARKLLQESANKV